MMWNLVDNFDVECGGERRCGICWGTVVWNVADNGYVKYGG